MSKLSKKDLDRLNTAKMFLEMASDEQERSGIAEPIDLIWAAHSYIQAVSNDMEPSEEAQALYAKTFAVVAIEDAMRTSK